MNYYQRTIKKSVSFSGVGLHSGSEIQVELRPAPANTGLVFRRTDLPNKPLIPAKANAVVDTMLSTRIASSKEAHVATIEHLMAALFGFGIDNLYIDIDNNEMPILDGSAAPFLVLLDEAGIEELSEPKNLAVIKKTIEVVDEKNPSRFIRIEPSKKPEISYAINFKKLGKQSISMDFNAATFCENFSYARTFCIEEDIERMYAMGLIKGGSLNNAVVVGNNGNILNTQGLRDQLECVKHKILDCIGDLYLVGMPILGHVIAHQAGHDLHTQLAKEILLQIQAQTAVSVQNANLPKFAEILAPLPKSLLDIEHNLVTLPIG